MSASPSQEDEHWVERCVEATRRALQAGPAPAAVPAETFLKDAPRTPAALAPYLDHTLLKPEATLAQVLAVASEAREHGFAGACVNPYFIPAVAQALRGSASAPVAVIGFPLGATFAVVKSAEAAQAFQAGARELDVVLNIGALKSGQLQLQDALDDLKGVVDAAAGQPVKVILETHLLTDPEKVTACVLAELAGAAFVKTSTGFTGGGATVKDVLLMRRAVGDRLAVKASGGIRDTAFALELVAAGARRLGASSSLALIRGSATQATY